MSMTISRPAAVPRRPAPADAKTLRALQLGMGWFNEQPGGLDRYYDELLRFLPSAGVDCRGLVAGSDRVVLESGGSVEAMTSSKTPLPQRWKQIRAYVSRKISEFKPDLFVSHFALYARPTMSLVRDLPHVVHFHGPWAEESRVEGAGAIATFLKRQVECGVYRRADALIVLSNAFGDILCNDYGVDRRRIHVIPGGVDIAKFNPAESRIEAREKLGWPTDRPIALAVRRLVSRMGLEELIDAAVEVKSRVPDALILIAGRGRLREGLERRIADKGIERHVRLLGYLPDAGLPLAYRAADMTVVPTQALEGFGLIVAESLAAGTPALVTPVGGLPETVGAFRPDLVLKDTTASSIARGMIQCMANPDALPAEHACREYARTHLSWASIAPRVANVYASVFRGKGPAQSLSKESPVQNTEVVQ